MTEGRKRILAVLVVLACVAVLLIAAYSFVKWRILSNEDPRFWEKKVAKIEARYNGAYPQGSVLFTGSSSIDFWKTLDRDMAPLKVLNHGIAGTKVADMTHYAGRLIAPFRPKAVVVYVGSNDINDMHCCTKSADEVFRLTTAFFDEVRRHLPGVPLYYISISPCRARWKVWKEAERANGLIRDYCGRSRNITFIDATPTLLENGVLRDDIYRFDGLHFNEKGYGLWTRVVRPVLVRDLAR